MTGKNKGVNSALPNTHETEAADGVVGVMFYSQESIVLVIAHFWSRFRLVHRFTCNQAFLGR